MNENLQALNRNVAPHFSARLQKMDAKEVRMLLNDIRKYQSVISPKVSRYMELARERKACEVRLKALEQQHG